MVRTLVVAMVVAASAPAAAQDTPLQPVQPQGCVPACRAGYVCSNGQCVSACNPPCPGGQVCTADLQCITPAGGGGGGATASGGTDPSGAAAGGEGSGGGGLGAAPPAASAARIAFGFHLGFGGESEGFDLEPTVGFHLRLEVPIGDYIAIGPMVIVGFVKPDLGGFGGNIDRGLYVDAALFVRAGVSFAVGSGHMTVYGGIPFGFSAGIPRNDLDAAFGLVVGLLPGIQVFFNDTLGVLLELGWLLHEHWRDGDEATTNQGVLNAGLVILL